MKGQDQSLTVDWYLPFSKGSMLVGFILANISFPASIKSEHPYFIVMYEVSPTV